jgi:trigger factor
LEAEALDMQVNEKNVEGLKREFEVVVPAAELDSRLVERLDSLKDEVRIKGFRPGKVPVAHLRKLFGRSTMAEIVQSTLTEIARKTLADRGEKAASQPDYQLPQDEAVTNRVLSGEADLSYTMVYEVLPKVELADFKGIEIERPVATPAESEIDEQIQRLANDARSYQSKDGKAETGDRVNISFVGSIDGEPFDGGSQDDVFITLGSDEFIPGFAEQVIGTATGDQKTIDVTFPDDYAVPSLAGKAAAFAVTVKDVASAEDLPIDDGFAERLGLESLEKLKATVREQVQAQYDLAVRQRIKRQMLDKLDELHAMELPGQMVEQEFQAIWRQISNELSSAGKTFESEGTTEEAARDDYRKIAERRVRLGLVMSEIGESNKIEVTEDEVQRALSAQLRQFPGREQAVLDYYKDNPEAIASLRAPIFEEKVVDYLLELVKVTDKPMTGEELTREDEEDEKLV